MTRLTDYVHTRIHSLKEREFDRLRSLCGPRFDKTVCHIIAHDLYVFTCTGRLINALNDTRKLCLSVLSVLAVDVIRKVSDAKGLAVGAWSNTHGES